MATRSREDDVLDLSLDSLKPEVPKQRPLNVPKHLEKYISKSLISYNPEAESIDKWISRVKPSEVVISQIGVAWISVHNRYAKNIKSSFCKDEYTKFFDLITDANDDQKKEAKWRCIQGIKEVARKQKYTTGKWMLFEELGNIDEAWCKVAKATVDGKLGHSAKVSTHQGKRDDELLICICVSDFTNKTQVKKLLQTIISMGFKPSSGFKPDVYTMLGIHSKNKWNLKPTIYQDMLSEVTSCTTNGHSSHQQVPSRQLQYKDSDSECSSGIHGNSEQNDSQFNLNNESPEGGAGVGEMDTGMGAQGCLQKSTPTVLFCFNIGYHATKDGLYALFSKYGHITKVDVIDGKGYGFVHMLDPFDAYEAMMGLNGSSYNGKVIQVSVKTKKI